MPPQKRAPKKVKKAKKANRGKKPARGKKSVAKKKSGGKKKTGRKVIRRGASVAAQHKGDPVGNLGEWSDDAGEGHDRQATLFDDEIPPDYGGSK